MKQIPQRIGITLPLHHIQTIRLCSALMESQYEFAFLPEAEPTLRHLSRFFPIRYHIGIDGVSIPLEIVINHEQPSCNIGSLTRPLVFPQEMVKKCRSSWKTPRTVKYSFCGHITKQRQQNLQAWVDLCMGSKARGIKIRQSPGVKARRLLRLLRQDYAQKVSYPKLGLMLFASDIGRISPGKAWDEAYYQMLCNSQFVLCPDGEYVWTYRFFEAALCGAIPIIQNSCDLYKGFHFFRMTDREEVLRWSHEAAEENFTRATEMLTIAPAELEECLHNLINKER